MAPMLVGLLLWMGQLSCELGGNWTAPCIQLGTDRHSELSSGLGPRLFTLTHLMQQMYPA